LGRRRRPVCFEVAGHRLRGMLDLPPVGVVRREVGVLMLNSDDGCRLGPHGLWTRLSDRMTCEGYPCLRFDYRGCGDSEGPEGPPSGIVGLTDAIAAEKVLRKQAGVAATVLVGICYGAEIGLLASRCLPTVCGVVACSTGRYVTDASYARAAGYAGDYARGYVHKLLSAEAWCKLLAGRVHVRLILQGLLDRLSWAHWRRDRDGAAAAEALAGVHRRRVPQLFIYGSADPLTRKHIPDYRGEAEEQQLDRHFRVIARADHNFSSVAWLQEVIESIAGFVYEVSDSLAEKSRVGAGDS